MRHARRSQGARQICVIRQQTAKPVNVNFFCHKPVALDLDRDAAWKRHLYGELGLDASASAPAVNRAPFGEALCEIVEDLRFEVVSFQFGLPEKPLLGRVTAAGSRELGCATTVEEARWLSL